MLNFFISSFGKIITPITAFFLKKAASSFPNLNGSWVYEQITTESSYNPYINMKLRYLALLRIDGEKLSGTSEKIWENSPSGGEREYVGGNRTTATIEGHIKKNFFSQDEVVIHLNENGHGRPYSTQHIINVKDGNLMEGRFTSTAANQIGNCKWIRKTT